MHFISRNWCVSILAKFYLGEKMTQIDFFGYLNLRSSKIKKTKWNTIIVLPVVFIKSLLIFEIKIKSMLGNDFDCDCDNIRSETTLSNTTEQDGVKGSLSNRPSQLVRKQRSWHDKTWFQPLSLHSDSEFKKKKLYL